MKIKNTLVVGNTFILEKILIFATCEWNKSVHFQIEPSEHFYRLFAREMEGKDDVA